MQRPNILWICTDRQRHDTLGCYDNEFVSTPHLDALAAGGVLFEQAWCQNPICAPSRASFLTGRYPRTTRVNRNAQRIPRDEKLISRLLADAGVRNREYSLSCVHGKDAGELYDLENDPTETRNLWFEPSASAAKIQMLKLLCDRMAQTIDPLPPTEAKY